MLKALLSLFLQNPCPLCQRSASEILCLDCQRRILACQRPHPHQFWQGDLPRFIGGTYDGALKRAIAALKYDGHRELGEFLGVKLGEQWLQTPALVTWKRLTVIPIPLHPDKQRSRGFNQAELIAQGFCQITGFSLKSQGLIRVKETQPLFTMTPEQRRQHIRQAIQVNPQISRFSSPILLIDDIYTTGATAREAKRALETQGHSLLGIAAIASPAT